MLAVSVDIPKRRESVTGGYPAAPSSPRNTARGKVSRSVVFFPSVVGHPGFGSWTRLLRFRKIASSMRFGDDVDEDFERVDNILYLNEVVYTSTRADLTFSCILSSS